MNDLDTISQAIGSLQAQAKEHGKQNDKLFDKLEEMHSDAQTAQQTTHDRLVELENCKLVVENEDRPAINTIATEVHSIKTRMEAEEKNFWKRTAKVLLAIIGVGGASGVGGSWFGKWWGL